jgi:ElaB/YqjD/DUF883 family membrane-anchored ribosome-binding protein
MMANSASRTIKTIENVGEDASDALFSQLANLRKELSTISDAISDFGGSTFSEVQHNANALVKEVRHQGKVVAKEVGKQASVASKAVQDNPVPVIIALGTVLLLSALFFARD